MKVLFIYNVFENLGIEYLSAVLKADGHQCSLVFDPRLFNFSRKDYSNKFLARLFDFRKHLLQQVIDYDPGLVAFSVVSADYLWACQFAREIKKLISVPIAFGGFHPTAVPERVIKKDFIDFLILGEGEYALLDLVNCLEAGEIDYAIKNVWFKRNGEIIRNPLRPLIQDLDSLPFADKDLFCRIGPPFDIGHMLLARRGCHNSCIYCGNNLRRKVYIKGNNRLKNKYFLRRRSVDNVIAELKWARQRYKIKLIRINDDDFAESKQWLKEFSEKYTGEIKVPYKCFVNCPSINEDTVAYLKRSGCQQIQMGIQSVNPEMRKILGRPMSNNTMSRAIRLIKESGIHLLVDSIFGMPGEREQDYRDLVDFYLENPVDFINAYWLVYFPGTDIVQLAREKKVLSDQLIEQMEEYPYQGDNCERSELHSRRWLKYKMLFESLNYFPERLSKFIAQYKLYYLFIPFNIFALLKLINTLKPKDPNKFPHPRNGYELNAFRYPKLAIHFGWQRIRMWFKFPAKVVKKGNV